MSETISANYLVVGAGAMGMAFIDTLLSDTEATIILVDRYDRPGGHWTVAYPFVRLHQPSAFYGVNSRPLGEDKIDQVGWNKGLAELATVDEICAYYSILMYRTFLPSGRVRYFPKHEYTSTGQFQSMITNKVIRADEHTCIVDATYMKVKVPSMGPPSYDFPKEVTLVTPNQLPKISRLYGGYTVVGAGKTGVDACLWLIMNGIHPRSITWIMPRDSWFYDRSHLQPGPEFTLKTKADSEATNQSIIAAKSPEDLFSRLESCGHLIRIDDKIWPTMFRCATISIAELEQIRRIGTIVRQGRIISLGVDEVKLEHGTYKPVPDSLYIDCTADGLAKLEAVPVFQPKRIDLQSVRHCQQVFSAAFIAHVETTYSDQKFKNDLCHVVPHPDQAIDYLTVHLQTYKNTLRWYKEPRTVAWLAQARLNFARKLLLSAPDDPAQAAEFFADKAANVGALCAKLEWLIDQASGH